jgi:IstB-like ATP binding protein
VYFQLVSSRYEHASLILTSNLPFWADVFSDHVVAAEMIDRIVHHADALTLKETATDCATPKSTHSRPCGRTTRQTRHHNVADLEEHHRPEFKERRHLSTRTPMTALTAGVVRMTTPHSNTR